LDKKIDDKFAILDKKIDIKFAESDKKIDDKFAILDKKFTWGMSLMMGFITLMFAVLIGLHFIK
ncbi:MAG: hypothetical protein ACYCTB_11575, partial [bacterium]